MKVRSSVLLTALLVAAVTGCASSAGTSAGSSRTDHPSTVTGNAPAPYMLYTHCGINDAKIGGRWFEADHPLSDGSGNPPPGWGNPYQPGTIRMLSATAAGFRDSLGHVVRFHVRAGAAGPKQVCALYRRAARHFKDPPPAVQRSARLLSVITWRSRAGQVTPLSQPNLGPPLGVAGTAG